MEICIEFLELLCDLYTFNIENENDNLSNELNNILTQYGQKKYGNKNQHNNVMKWIETIRKFIAFIKDNINNTIDQLTLDMLMNNITNEINEMEVDNKLVSTIYYLICTIYNYFLRSSESSSDSELSL